MKKCFKLLGYLTVMCFKLFVVYSTIENHIHFRITSLLNPFTFALKLNENLEELVLAVTSNSKVISIPQKVQLQKKSHMIEFVIVNIT